MTTYLGKSCSFCLPRVPFVNCHQFMYLVISLLVLRAGYGIWLYQFLIIAYLFTLNLLPILNTNNCSVCPLAFVAGSLQGHWWGFISRNYVIWPIFFLMNVFIALKGTHFWFLFKVTEIFYVDIKSNGIYSAVATRFCKRPQLYVLLACM